MSLPSAQAASVQELLEQGDRLTQTDEGFPDGFTRALTLYEKAAALDTLDPLPHIRAARACLALGDWLGKDTLQWYERGEQAAERALALKEDRTEAHFYLAANRGNVVNLRPFWKVSPTVVADLEKHLQRALELDPRHARALHMMGVLLDETPGPLRLLLVGKKGQVEGYLTRAVEADLKSISASRTFHEFPWLRRTYWSGELWENGYAVRTVGDHATADLIKRYIRRHADQQATNQPELF